MPKLKPGTAWAVVRRDGRLQFWDNGDAMINRSRGQLPRWVAERIVRVEIREVRPRKQVRR